jgi:hypothetical protein
VFCLRTDKILVPELLSEANRFLSRAARCEAFFLGGPAMANRAYATIRLYSEWEEFCRRLIETSALRNPRTAGGVVVPRPPGIKDFQDVDKRLRKIFSKKPKQNYAVPWGTPYQMVRVSAGLGLANHQTIQAAILASNSPANDLRLIRNFLAHRNPGTALQLRHGISDHSVADTVNWLAALQLGGATRMEAWVEDLSDVALAAVQ